MSHQNENMINDLANGVISRRSLLRALGMATVAAPFATALGQGKCIHKLGTIACNTSAIPPVFAATGWKTISLEHITMQVVDVQKEAAFYNALVGWTMRSGDDKQAIMDIGKWGTVVLQHMDLPPGADTAGAGGRAGGAGGRGARGPARANVESFCFGISPWNAKNVEAELKKRGMTPVADNDGKGFESFHVKDLDGFDLQISNGGQAKYRAAAKTMAISAPAPFEPTGWKTVWLDHFSFNVSNYKQSASFYMNLMGWTSSYDEGSQNELLMGEVGDIIVRGPNPLDPDFGKGGRGGGAGAAAAGAPVRRQTTIDHISFGITPFDADDVKAQLEKRGLQARVDTSTGDDIHVAAYKSYHTITPNGYNLQISYVNHDTRLALPTAVTPKAS